VTGQGGKDVWVVWGLWCGCVDLCCDVCGVVQVSIGWEWLVRDALIDFLFLWMVGDLRV
jgi:hypothetical protein